MAWCIWYADKTTFSSEDGSAADAPGIAVVVIAQDSGSPGRRYTVQSQGYQTVHGYDWYIYVDDTWFATNLMGLCQFIAEPGPKIIKMGRWVHPDVFAELMGEAVAWVP